MRVLLLVLVSLAAFQPAAYGDEVFGRPGNTGFNTDFVEGGPSLTSDGLSLYFHSDRPGGQGLSDLWVVRRRTSTGPWEKPENLGPVVNTSTGEYNPGISHNGLSLYFSSNRPGGSGGYDLYLCTRTSVLSEWGKAVNLGSAVNTSRSEISPAISKDGLQLFFSDEDGLTPRDGGLGNSDLWVTTRLSASAPWGRPVNLGQPVISGAAEVNPILSPDGLMLFFSSDRAGGQGWNDIWVSTRANLDGKWTAPKNTGPGVNCATDDNYLCLSPDGQMLYLSSFRNGGQGKSDIWQIPILSTAGFADLVGKQ